MNFQDLLTKIKQLDETQTDECGGQMDVEPSKMPSDDMLTGECGGMMSMGAPKQSDSVTMNVSMNGSGSGGIRDLIGILRNIEQAGDSKDSDDVLVGIGADETFDNEPNPQVADVSTMTPTGDDIHSKGKEALKVNGGGNPMHEALVAKLSEKYQAIKGS